MATLKHDNGSLLNNVPDDQVERYLSYGWSVQGETKTESKDSDEKAVEEPKSGSRRRK